ncbi:Lipase_GDSL domain-containing protein [Cephalotus follicularis]|uniref:Lipase_GDSL domain-containing protein n=1 Tax=Cephalotus follicularis TaxID=3775 RepID=A0A1Q3B070_CEPFO|nr:Lipase_GDSL domain-containing protein [Cephalotus follicularis]
MAMATQNYLLCATLVYAAAILINPIACCGHSTTQRKLLFVFGDSLFDAGNNQYLTTGMKVPSCSFPYGIDFHNRSTGRFSDGLLVPDFIAKFANLHLEPPSLEPGANFTDGANFASAGGTVLPSTNYGGPLNLATQITDFKKVFSGLKQKLGKDEAKEVLMSSVILLSMGGNDYFSFNMKYPNSTVAQMTAYMHMVIGNLTNDLKEIYNIGGRKFGIQNVGPLGCQPGLLALYPEFKGTCATKILSHAHMHNIALSFELMKLKRELRGFKYALFDFFHALRDRILYPKKHGFEVGRVACCGSGPYNASFCGGGYDGKIAYNLCSNRNEYVFFDGAHNTQRTNHQLAVLFWNGTRDVSRPYNVKRLFDLP